MEKNQVGAPTDGEIADVAKMALDDFWERVAKQFPHAKTGDLSPEVVIQLETTAKEAIKQWWNNNCKDVI